MTTEPLWENEEWAIWPNGIQFKMTFFMFRPPIEADPLDAFETTITETGGNPDLLYDAFLQLATLWDLQCNYDELRKIRDQAKQEKTG